MIESDSPLNLNGRKRGRRGYGAQSAEERKKRRRAFENAERERKQKQKQKELKNPSRSNVNVNVNDNDNRNDTDIDGTSKTTRKSIHRSSTCTRSNKTGGRRQSMKKIPIQVKITGRTKTSRSRSRSRSRSVRTSTTIPTKSNSPVVVKSSKQRKNNRLEDPFDPPSSSSSNSSSSSRNDESIDRGEKENASSTANDNDELEVPMPYVSIRTRTSTSTRTTTSTRTPQRKATCTVKRRKIRIEESQSSSSSSSISFVSSGGVVENDDSDESKSTLPYPIDTNTNTDDNTDDDDDANDNDNDNDNGMCSNYQKNTSSKKRPIRNARNKPLNYAEYDDDISSVSSHDDDDDDRSSNDDDTTNDDDDPSNIHPRQGSTSQHDENATTSNLNDRDRDRDRYSDQDHEQDASSTISIPPLTQKHFEMNSDDDDDGYIGGGATRNNDPDPEGTSSWSSSIEDEIADFNNVKEDRPSSSSSSNRQACRPSSSDHNDTSSSSRRRKERFQLCQRSKEDGNDDGAGTGIDTGINRGACVRARRRKAQIDHGKYKERSEIDDNNDNGGGRTTSSNDNDMDMNMDKVAKEKVLANDTEDQSKNIKKTTKAATLRPRKRQGDSDLYDGNNTNTNTRMTNNTPTPTTDTNRLSILPELCTTFESLKATDATKDSVKDIVQCIVQEYHNLYLSMKSHQTAIVVVGNNKEVVISTISVRLIRASFNLLDYHSEEAISIMCCCIQYHLRSFDSSEMGIRENNMSVEELYRTGSGRTLPSSIDNERFCEAKPLLRDIQIIRGILHTLVYIMEDENTLTIEENGIPLLYYLHCLEPHAFANITLDTKRMTNAIIEDLSALMGALPQMHSYPIMELLLSFLHKFRFHALASLDRLSEEKEKTRCIDFMKRLFSKLPTQLVNGVECMDPPLSRDVVDQLYDPRSRKMLKRSQKDFVAWSRSVVTKMNCPHVSYFSCNGIYAPRDDGDIGTQIAKIKWVEVNRDNFSFFHCLTMSDGADEPDNNSSKCTLFPRHHLISIPFEFFADEGHRGTLCNKDCALTLPISSSKWNGSELSKLLIHPCNGNGKSLDLVNKKGTNLLPLCIKIFIKRSEYATFEAALTENRRHLNVSVEQSDDCSSTFSNIETTMSRSMSRKDTKDARKRVKLSTKLNPEQMLDAARCIREGTLSEDGASRYLSRGDDGKISSQQSMPVSLKQNREVKNHNQIQNLSTPSPKSSMPMEVMFYKTRTRENSKQNSNGRNAAEITPLQLMNSNPNSNFNSSRLTYNYRGPLETLSAVMETFEHSEMKSMSFRDFVNHSRVQETADSVITFERTMDKASKIMNELAADHQRMMENMQGGPNENKIGKMTDWIQRTTDIIQRSGEEWAQMRQSYEHNIAKTLWSQK